MAEPENARIAEIEVWFARHGYTLRLEQDDGAQEPAWRGVFTRSDDDPDTGVAHGSTKLEAAEAARRALIERLL